MSQTTSTASNPHCDPLIASQIRSRQPPFSRFVLHELGGLPKETREQPFFCPKWVIDNNGRGGRQIIDPDDPGLADLLVRLHPAKM